MPEATCADVSQLLAAQVRASQRVVDRSRERPLAHAWGTVEQRTRWARYRDPLMPTDVPAHERGQSVDGDARRAPVQGDGHFDPRGAAVDKPPQP